MNKKMVASAKAIVTITGCSLLLIAATFRCLGQEQDPVSWRFSAKKINGRTFEVHIRASINAPWHIYAQDVPTGTALPTSIRFNKNQLVTLQGTVTEEGKAEQKMEQGIPLKYYCTKVDFVQVVKVKGDVKTTLSGTLSYMVCTHDRCLPPFDKNFSIVLDGRN